MENNNNREIWASKVGLILAMAGNAIGLGNFLRFPVQAAKNGGGAFMIPYFTALILLGIPLMWVEWGLGRYGGKLGSGTSPAIFESMCKNRIAKYIGVLGICIPLVFVIYYTYIESWTFGYSFFSLTGKYFGNETREAMGSFLHSYQGVLGNGEAGTNLPSFLSAYIFFMITLAINIWILSKGVVKGIETLAKIAMPALFIFAAILVIRVFTLGTPNPAVPENNVLNGLAFIWNPDFGKLSSASVWLAAAGQIFFTLSIGTGSLLTYASYVREKDDIALSGLTTSMTNEFAEVILGGSIAIPVAVAFFGVTETTDIARSGAFNLGFQAMPIIFQRLPWGQLFGGLWFMLLFFAGITSSVALAQPAMAFLQDELKISRQRAAIIIGSVIFVCTQPVIFYLGHGFLDEMDYWAGAFGLVVFALFEVIIFAWIFGMDNAWGEINQGAHIRLPRIFYYIIKYISPAYLIVLLLSWAYFDAGGILILKKDPYGDPIQTGDIIYRLGARLMMAGLFVVIALLVRYVWKKNRNEKKYASTS
ncbi:MAG: sodium-dependent transporter [Acidobacteriota bacterium]